MNNFVDYFFVLQVHYFASNEVIKAAYRKLSQKSHPDVSGDSDEFVRIQEAYETLIDESKRKAYTKLWMNHYMPHTKMGFNRLNKSINSASVKKIEKVLKRYLQCIKDKSFKEAYQLLSVNNRSKMFVRDYVVWQKLIAEIHHLLAFDCAIEDYERRDNDVIIHFKVHVKEYNKLLNRVEEDYFVRELIYENDQWHILLKNIDIKTIIRKYKKILALNKKNAKVLHKYLPKLEENHFTKMVSKKYFVNNTEYELLRFKRYNREFSLISIKLLRDDLNEMVEHVLKHETRDIDCFCKYAHNVYLILLPETSKVQCQIVIEKLMVQFNLVDREVLTFEALSSDLVLKSVKEMLNTLLIGKRI